MIIGLKRKKSRAYFSGKRISCHHENGFTLVEICIVVTIISLLAALETVYIVQSLRTAREAVCDSNRREIQDAEMGFLTRNGRHSSNLHDLVTGKYFPVLPKCPSNGVYTWAMFNPTIYGPSDSEFYSDTRIYKKKGELEKKYKEKYKEEAASLYQSVLGCSVHGETGDKEGPLNGTPTITYYEWGL